MRKLLAIFTIIIASTGSALAQGAGAPSKNIDGLIMISPRIDIPTTLTQKLENTIGTNEYSTTQVYDGWGRYNRIEYGPEQKETYSQGNIVDKVGFRHREGSLEWNGNNNLANPYYDHIQFLNVEYAYRMPATQDLKFGPYTWSDHKLDPTLSLSAGGGVLASAAAAASCADEHLRSYAANSWGAMFWLESTALETRNQPTNIGGNLLTNIRIVVDLDETTDRWSYTNSHADGEIRNLLSLKTVITRNYKALDPMAGQTYAKWRKTGDTTFYGLNPDFVIFYDSSKTTAASPEPGGSWTGKFDPNYAILAKGYDYYTHGDTHDGPGSYTTPSKVAWKQFGSPTVVDYEAPSFYRQDWNQSVKVAGGTPQWVIDQGLLPPGFNRYIQIFAKERMGAANGQPQP